MKKARKWLDSNHLDYEFHDYKKPGIPEKKLKQWVKQAGWETVLNKRGTSWRRLDENTRNNIDKTSAISIMMENPSAIKCPVVEKDNMLLIGFNEDDYQKLL